MIYLRQLWKQKPEAWGPVEAVQAAIRKNAAGIGIDPESIVLCLPMWERSGNKIIDYIGIKCGTLYPSTLLTNNGLLFTDTSSRVEFPVDSIAFPTTQYTVHINGYLDDLYGTTTPKSLLGVGGAGYTDRFVFGFNNAGSGGTHEPRMSISDIKTSKQIIGNTDVLDTMYNLTFVYNGSNNILYMDGNIESYTGTEPGAVPFTNKTVTIGMCNYCLQSLSFCGGRIFLTKRNISSFCFFCSIDTIPNRPPIRRPLRPDPAPNLPHIF